MGGVYGLVSIVDNLAGSWFDFLLDDGVYVRFFVWDFFGISALLNVLCVSLLTMVRFDGL